VPELKEGDVAMKKYFAAAISFAAIITAIAPATAADMAVKAPPMAPLPVIYNWTGFYIGANGGWGSSRNCWDFVTVAGAIVTDGCADRSGGLIGGQIGYRWQTGGWVFGLEAQGDWADLNHTRISLIDPTFSTRARTDGIGLFTGQIGYAWNAALFYVKGGAAVTSNSFDILTTLGGVSVASASSVSDSSTALHRTGRSASNTITCSWAMRTIRSRWSTPSWPVRPTVLRRM
jgi:outer membrane immunogenic protein